MTLNNRSNDPRHDNPAEMPRRRWRTLTGRLRLQRLAADGFRPLQTTRIPPR